MEFRKMSRHQCFLKRESSIAFDPLSPIFKTNLHKIDEVGWGLQQILSR
jgi:hypothetical protein